LSREPGVLPGVGPRAVRRGGGLASGLRRGGCPGGGHAFVPRGDSAGTVRGRGPGYASPGCAGARAGKGTELPGLGPAACPAGPGAEDQERGFPALNPPTTYAEWIRLLDALKAGTDDDAVLPALMAGRLHWQSGVAERFTRVLGEVLDARLQRLGDKLQRDLDRARGNEAGVV